jgi:hypothetical protein
MVEAGGVEPPSRSRQAAGVYVRSLRIVSRPAATRGRAGIGTSLGKVSSEHPEAQISDQPAVGVPSQPQALREGTATYLTRQQEKSCWQLKLPSREDFRVTRGPRHAAQRRSKPVETSAPPPRC